MAAKKRPRDALGRFMTSVKVDEDAVRADYEAGELTVVQVGRKHGIGASTVNRMVGPLGWKPRAPHRIDPSDLIQRMLAQVETQIADLETCMTEYGPRHAMTLQRLMNTLDKAIALRNVEARTRRPRGENRSLDELRHKIAQRVADLTGN